MSAMTDTPLAEAAWRDVTLAHLFAPLRAAVGLDQPEPEPEPEPEPVRRKPRRGSETRLRILHESALIYAVSAS